MPCTCEGTAEMDRAAIEKELHDVTRWTCLLMARIDGRYDGALPGDLVQWWVRHKNADMSRKDRLVGSALAKLTADEREALGIR